MQIHLQKSNLLFDDIEIKKVFETKKLKHFYFQSYSIKNYHKCYSKIHFNYLNSFLF